MYGLAIAVVFWVLLARGFYRGSNPTVLISIGALWIALFALPWLAPAMFNLAAVLRIVLMVVLALWLKLHGDL